MIFEYAMLTVAANDIDAFAKALPEAESVLRESPGCESVAFQHSTDRPEVFLLKVGWQRLEDHTERFASSELATRLGDLIGRFFVEPPFVAHFPQ